MSLADCPIHDTGLVTLSVAGGVAMESSPRLEADDLALLRRVVAQDRHAFEALYHRYAPRVCRYVSRFIRRRETVEEVLDDVMIVVWQAAARFDQTSRLSTWILGIAHHKALKALGKSGGRTAELPADTPDPTEAGSAEDRVARGELSRAVARALATLSVEQQAVVELAFYQDLSYQEIAEIMGCPVNTVKTRMFHARRRLAPLLAEPATDRSPRPQEESR